MTAREGKVEAQAKLNLFLRVLSREDSGYHQIETMFCRIALSDTVTVSVGNQAKRLQVEGPRVPIAGLGPVERNVAWKAAEAYAAATGYPGGFDIRIEKRIPVGGGLGGGSADAGGVLRVLNALNPDPVDAPKLLDIASTLGADVPFLTQDDSAMAIGRGYGERLEILPALPSRPVWLLVPDVGVNTAEAYGWLDSARGDAAQALGIGNIAGWEALARVAVNDFEPVVGAKVPIIGRLLAGFRSPQMADVLGESAMVLMSGSGSTVAVIAGQVARNHWAALPPIGGVDVVETQTAAFVEPVVLTH